MVAHDVKIAVSQMKAVAVAVRAADESWWARPVLSQPAVQLAALESRAAGMVPSDHEIRPLGGTVGVVQAVVVLE